MKDIGDLRPDPGIRGKMPELNSFPWVELGVLAPGQSHYWFFDQPRELRGWVFQATAYPEAPDGGEEHTWAASRVEVTELFIMGPSQINITVTNCDDRWAGYSLWVVSVPPRNMRHHSRRP
jgi:hypothetical protein